jgi:hypothetical protein
MTQFWRLINSVKHYFRYKVSNVFLEIFNYVTLFVIDCENPPSSL